ncbi:Prophage CP4-57 regulatory protein (AlpA) [compost metagenome]
MKILRKKDMLALTGVSATTLWRWERAGLLPKRVRLGPGAIGWIEEEIYAWLTTRPRGMAFGKIQGDVQ